MAIRKIKVGKQTRKEIQTAVQKLKQKRRQQHINRIAAGVLATSGLSPAAIQKKIAARKEAQKQAALKAQKRSLASGGQ